MSTIKAKNITAQLHYRARGNPPQTHPEAAVGNFFPGLEFNFQNVWKRIFIGLDLLEYGGQIIGVNEDQVRNSGGDIVSQGPDKASLVDMISGFLEMVDGVRLYTEVIGPVDDPSKSREQIYFEWSNALSKIHADKGGTDKTVECYFVKAAPSAQQDQHCTCDARHGPFRLKVRRLIEPDMGLISREASLAGELTESLCSPWQTDYIGCACYYWASNRPDYINIVPVEGQEPAGATTGHNWLNLSRILDEKRRPLYTLQPDNLLTHEDIMQGWEHKFQFIIEGNDAPDGSVSRKKAK